MKFLVEVTVMVEVEFNDEIAALANDAEWVDKFYGLDTPESIAQHLAWNIAVRDRDLSGIDGFADRSNDEVSARVEWVDFDVTAAP